MKRMDVKMIRKEFLELKSTLCEGFNNRTNFRTAEGFKKLTDAINAFIKIFGESTLEVAINFSVKDFFVMLEVCKDHKEFKELFSKVVSLVDNSIPQKRVIGVYSPKCLETMKREFEEWGDEEDWEYIKELEEKLKPLYKDLRFQYMV